MKNDKFARLLEYRKNADKAVHDVVLQWATDEGLDDITLGQIRSLSSTLIAMNNRAARDAFDIASDPEAPK